MWSGLKVWTTELLHIDDIPHHYREHCIVHGYRKPKSSATDCVLSLFQLTNETLNFWTHFLPFWYFIWRLVAVSYDFDFWVDPYTWPLLVFMLSCCAYPITSSMAHCFNCMSDRAQHISYFMDYGALSLYSLGSGIAYHAYVFPDAFVGSWFDNVFLRVAAGLAVGCTLLSCTSRFEDRPKMRKAMRLLSFSLPYFFNSIPLCYRVFLCHGEGCSHNEAVIIYYWMLFFSFLTPFLYATHIPEVLAPGKFDIIGHSHQLFHVTGIIATNFQISGVLTDLQARREFLETVRPQPVEFWDNIGLMLLVLAKNLLIILFFTLSLYLEKPTWLKVRSQGLKGKGD
ncbi:Progestin and adipoQ receptor member [Branchiostoma belcheri]|nr:Progestin and adipoQ receptor member [Branchiostoma belcheri]